MNLGTSGTGAAGQSASTQRPPDAATLIHAIQAHRQLPREGQVYWDRYCELVKALCRATAVLIAQRHGAGEWRPLGADLRSDDWLRDGWRLGMEELVARALHNGFAFSPVQDASARTRILAFVRVSGVEGGLLVLDIAERERAQLNELMVRALLAADFPAPPAHAGGAAALLPATRTVEEPAGPTVQQSLLELLDLAAQVMGSTHFKAAALTLANGLAAHFGAAQAVLGWDAGDGIEAVALSHVDRFERNTQTVQLFEDALNEAAALGAEVRWTGDRERQALLPAHARAGETLGFKEQLCVPIRNAADQVTAVVYLGFSEIPKEPVRTDALLMAMDLLEPWLASARQRDRWWGARAGAWASAHAARLAGPDHPWAKILAVTGSLLLLYALFGKWDYEVEANAQITTDSTRIISAQFDSRVSDVRATAGDVVRAGAVLGALDVRELTQQELDVGAEGQRLAAEADKARAAGNLADLQIAQARLAQAEARLARVRYYLAQSKAVAPFDGVIVEGERKDLMNAPVKKGDRLFRIARIDGLYVELTVPEREILYVRAGSIGHLRLLSHPDQKIAFRVETFIPVAQVKGQEGNHFLVKARLAQAPEAWWRPGMSGMAHIDAGRRNIAWILTHKLVDTLRMKLSWLWW